MMEIKPPEHESMLGMEVYKSKTPGIGGAIKKIPEDFIVEEITKQGRVVEVNAPSETNSCNPCPENRQLHFTLQKYNWDTMRAVKEIAKQLHVSHNRLGFAGTKDKKALTAQRVSIWDKKIEDLEKVAIKDILLKDYEYCNDNIGLGDLEGNRFTLVIRGLADDEDALKKKIDSIIEELHGQVPAFFGVQRFGSVRPITHLVGKEIIKGDFREAVMVYLANEYPGEEKSLRETRARLRETGDYRQALRDFPRRLNYENALLNHLINAPDDYIGALRKLPKNLEQMFIHAYQGYIFNKSLSEYIRRDIPVDRLPLAGYQTGLDEITEKILQDEGIGKEQFRIRQAPHLSSKGGYRDCFTPIEGFETIGAGDDEMEAGKKKLTIRFRLHKGNYATVFLRELMKN